MSPSGLPAVMAMLFAIESVRTPPSPMTTSACEPRASATPSSTVFEVALGTTSSKTMCGTPFLSSSSWTRLMTFPS